MRLQDAVFLRIDKKNIRVNFSDIIYIQSSGNYVHVVTAQQVFMTLLSLRQLEEILPADYFCRVSRSYIVSLNHVAAFDCTCVHIGDKEIPIGEHFKDVLPSKLRVVQSDVRHQASISSRNIISMDKLQQVAN